MGYIDTIPTDAGVSKGGAVVEKKESKGSNIPLKILNPNKSATSSLISNEEKVEKETKKESLNEWLEKRSSIRKDILSGKISAGNKGADTGAVRKSRLADLARGTLIDLGKNPDNIKKISDDDLIKRLTSDKKGVNQKKLDLVNDYIKNGGYAEEVYEELTTNKKVDKKGFRTSTAISTAEVPYNTLLNLTDMSNSLSSKIVNGISEGLGVDEKTARNLTNLIPGLVSPVYTLTQGINQLFGLGSDESYKDAIENGYDGTKEEFKKQDTLTNKARGLLPDDDTLDKNGKKVGDFLGEGVELAAAPEMKLKWLGKFGEKGVGKLLKNAGELGLEGASFQALEDVNKGELSSASDYLTSAGTNSLIGLPLRTVIRGVSGLSKKSQAALNTKTEAEWNKMSKITDDYFNKAGNKVTPYSEIINILRSAKDTLSKKRKAAGKALEDAEKNLKYGETQYTAKDVLNDLQTELSKLGEGPNAKTPIFEVNGNKLTIKNKDAFASRDADGVSHNLGKEIEDAWNEVFTQYDRAVTPRTTALFIQRVENLLKDYGGAKVGGESIKAIRTALKGVENAKGEFEGGIKKKFSDSLTEKTRNARVDARGKTSNSINVDKDFDDIIGNLETVSGQKKALNLNQYSDATTEDLFRLVQEETNIDLNNEIGAWIVNIALRDPTEAERLIKTFYPSSPGATEFVMKNIIGKLQKAGASRYTKDGGSSAAARLAETMPGMATNEMLDIRDIIK